MSEDEQLLLAALSSAQDGLGIEHLVEVCNMPASRVTSALMCLELTGLVRQLPGKIFEKIG
jgi:DNA-binding IclR family transcriptional regulator